MSENPTPARIGNYEILGELGRGGMGVVYKATETSLHRVVALKVLPPHFSRRPEYIGRFLQEARAVAQLNHPNVVTLFQIGEHKGSHYIAMEYLKGEELNRLIAAQGRLDVVQALSIARQVASALGAAHELSIVHRDIKPQNLMVDALGRVKVMDFGVAKLEAAVATIETTEGMLLGTPAFMAPEQFQFEEVDARSDLYSLGVVLFYCLAGRVPFEGDTPANVMYRVLNDPPPPIDELVDDLPPGVANLIDRALAKDPAKRFQTAREFQEAIDAVLTVPMQPRPVQLETERISTSDVVTQVLHRDELRPDPPPTGLAALGSLFWALPLRLRIGAGAAALVVLAALFVSASVRRDPEDVPDPEAAAGSPRIQLQPVERTEPDPITAVGEPTPEVDEPPPPPTREDIRRAVGLFSGTAGRVDEAEARTVLIRAAEAGDPIGLMWCAWLHQRGLAGFEEEPEWARSYALASIDAIRTLAERDDPDAHFLLGAALTEGLAVEPDAEAGMAWVMRAVDVGHVPAMNYLAWMYRDGHGTPPNAGLALLWYQRAADAGDVEAMIQLGRIYLENDDVSGADRMAAQWFQRGAEAGSAASMTQLARMYRHGRGVELDEMEAERWYREAARLGDAEALTQLGELSPGS
jgi:serine/threonine protein kinase